MLFRRRLLAGVAVSLLCAPVSSQAQGFEWTGDDAERLTGVIASGTYGRITSVWIEQHGDIVFERYFHGADAGTHHNMRSAGKTVTGMLIGTAIEDGHIEAVTARADEFFPELRPFENDDPRKERITLQDLLTMSGSGGNRVYALPEFAAVVVITKSDFRDRDAHAKTDRFFDEEVVARLREN